MPIAEQLYFSTPIYTGSLDGAADLNPVLRDQIYEERRLDPEGRERSNYPAMGGWHSRIDLHRSEPYADLVARVTDALAHISEDSGYDPAYRLEVTSMWANINGPGGSNRSHIHPKSDWSGVYYIQASTGGGKIEFTDPRTTHLMQQPRYIKGQTRKKSRWTKVEFSPRPGLLVAFPSWLYHAVAPNLTDETGPEADRIVIAFNAQQKRCR